jgi:hypothetical protein
VTSVTSIVVDLLRYDMPRVKNLRFVHVVAKIARQCFEDGFHRPALVVTHKVFDIKGNSGTTGRSLLCMAEERSCIQGSDSSGTRFVRANAQRGKGSGMSASAYPMTAMAAAFSRSSCGTILSSVSAAVW